MSYNITKIIKNTEKLNIIKALNCDEKYINGSASDFEWFDMWESAAFLCLGHGELEKYARELSVFGLSFVKFSECCREIEIERWRKALDKDQTEIFNRNGGYTLKSSIGEEYICKNLGISIKREPLSFVDINKYVLDFTISSENVTSVADRICDRIGFDKSTCKILTVSLLPGEYRRPDPYLANKLFLQKKSGEFLNYTEENIIHSQILIELLIRLKEEKNIAVLIRKTGDVTPSVSLAEYLDMRRLLSGEVWIELGDLSELEYFSRIDTRIRPRPFIDISRTCISGEELLGSFNLYPVGAFVFKDGRDSRELVSAIGTVCQSKEQTELLMSLICI